MLISVCFTAVLFTLVDLWLHPLSCLSLPLYIPMMMVMIKLLGEQTLAFCSHFSIFLRHLLYQGFPTFWSVAQCWAATPCELGHGSGERVCMCEAAFVKAVCVCMHKTISSFPPPSPSPSWKGWGPLFYTVWLQWVESDNYFMTWWFFWNNYRNGFLDIVVVIPLWIS